MMPTFPLPPLKFRTAGFPRYGFKAGLSDEPIPLGGERACESLREVQDVLATNQTTELRKLFGPSQFSEQGAQSDEQVDI
jgi:hypothetical protein